MILSKHIFSSMSWLICIVFMGNISSARAENEVVTANTRITATFSVPTCELVIPPIVHLGSIINGVQSYNPFSIQMNCSVPTDTSIYAQAIGRLAPGSIDTVLMEGSNARFWLLESTMAKKITLNGDAGETFCSGGVSRICNLIPNTLVTSDDARGETYTVIRFNVRYNS